MSNLIDRYMQADPSMRNRGRAWYGEARRACTSIARDCGIALDRVAAVMAITSPDAKLVQNIAWTRAACEAYRDGAPLTAGRYPKDQIPKVAGALDQRKNPGYFVRGPKVSAFYRSIMGDTTCLTIDRWAVEAAGGDRSKVPGKTLRGVLTAAYQLAAANCGESVRDFQAIVWIQARETTARSDGRVVRHFDF